MWTAVWSRSLADCEKRICKCRIMFVFLSSLSLFARWLQLELGFHEAFSPYILLPLLSNLIEMEIHYSQSIKTNHIDITPLASVHLWPTMHYSPLPFHLRKERFLGIVQTRLWPCVASRQTQQIVCAERAEAASWFTPQFSSHSVAQSRLGP